MGIEIAKWLFLVILLFCPFLLLVFSFLGGYLVIKKTSLRYKFWDHWKGLERYKEDACNWSIQP